MASEPCGSRLQPLLFLWSHRSSVCGRRLSASSLAFRSLLPSELLSHPCGARSPSLPQCKEMSTHAPKCHTEGLRRKELLWLMLMDWTLLNTFNAYCLTFFYELSPTFSPLCQLLCISLLNTCPLVDAVHQFIAQAVAIIHPFHRFLVVTNLRTSNSAPFFSIFFFFFCSVMTWI